MKHTISVKDEGNYPKKVYPIKLPRRKRRNLEAEGRLAISSEARRDTGVSALRSDFKQPPVFIAENNASNYGDRRDPLKPRSSLSMT